MELLFLDGITLSTRRDRGDCAEIMARRWTRDSENRPHLQPAEQTLLNYFSMVSADSAPTPPPPSTVWSLTKSKVISFQAAV